MDMDAEVPAYRWLVAGILFVVVVRLALYAWHPELGTDFDLLYYAAQHVLQRENPYPIARQWSSFPLFYPMPAVLLALPFVPLRVEEARAAFDILVGSVFAYALWRYRGPYALLAVGSGAALFAMRNGQMTPLVTGASLIPALGFLVVLKPNIGLALWAARPAKLAVMGGLTVTLLSLLVLPSWPLDWWHALQTHNAHLAPPVLRPFGFLLLLAALRWRTAEGRLLLALAVIPQNLLPHELVPLALIPTNAIEMGIYVIGSWLAVIAVGQAWGSSHTTIATLNAAAWPAMLGAVYLPMLWLVLRRRVEKPAR